MKRIRAKRSQDAGMQLVKRPAFGTQAKLASDYFTQTLMGSQIHTKAMDPSNRPPEIEKFHQQLKTWTLQHLKCEYRVLEAGCGTGTVLLWLSPVVESVVGVDNAPLKVRESQDAVLREHLMNVEILEGDFFRLSVLFKRHPFDMICLFTNTLGNFPGREAELLRALAMGLKKDGQILLQLYGGGFSSAKMEFLPNYWLAES